MNFRHYTGARSAIAFSVSALLAGSATSPATLCAAETRPLSANTQVPLLETKGQHDARMKWWREARFGMFIHWSLYSQAGGYWNGKKVVGSGLSEWIMNDAKIPIPDYAKLAQTFNPVKFDADAWVTVARQAGMKYIVITSKHHDGFAMFHTAADPFNVFDATPFKRDPIAELAVAARKQGIKLGFYYSQAQDWSHAGGGSCRGSWDPAQNGSMDDYLKNIAIPQVKELLTRYGPVSVLWWDTPCGMNPERASQFSSLLKLQPQIITNDRLGGGYRGDTGTPEGEIPPFPLTDRDWETCMTMNGSWGYSSDAANAVRTTPSLLLDLINTASKGGNYLLNVGPDAEGRIPAAQVERLQQIGQWLKVNGESIYGTSALPVRNRPTWGRLTYRPGKLYLHVLSRPEAGNIIVPISNRVSEAYLLAAPKQTKKTLIASRTAQGTTIRLPGQLADPIDTVIVVEFDGQLALLAKDVTTRPDSNGTFQLDATKVQITHGEPSKEEPRRYQSNLSGEEHRHYIEWLGRRGAEDVLQWQIAPKAAGDYEVIFNYATWPYQVGGAYTFTVGTQTLTGTLTLSKSGYAGEDFKVGTIHLDGNSPVVAVLKGTSTQHSGMSNRLFRITLKPVF